VSVETLEPDTVDPTVDPEREEATGTDAGTGRAPSADIPGGAEAMPLLWVVLTPAGIGRPRQARGPFVDPTEARAYGREVGGGYEVVEFVFPAVSAARSGRAALDALAATIRRVYGGRRSRAVPSLNPDVLNAG